MGRLVFGMGLLLVLLGLLLIGLEHLGVPWGKLPGDLSFRGKHFQVFAPLGTSLLLSALLSLLLYAVTRWRR